MKPPRSPQCGSVLAPVCFLGTGTNGYYCPDCRSWLDTSLRVITRPACLLAEVG
jgi:hypothetical protein